VSLSSSEQAFFGLPEIFPADKAETYVMGQDSDEQDEIESLKPLSR